MSESVRIHDLPQSDKPRERLANLGAEALKPEELVAILLRTGMQGRNVIEVSRELLQKFDHSLGRLARASITDLTKVKGIGRDKAVTLLAAFKLATRMADELIKEPPVLDNPDAVANVMRERLRDYEVETFHVLLVNTRRRMIACERVSQGTLDTVLVHPREVFRAAIGANASALILTHNHPSGDPSPSEADIRVTRDLIRAGVLLKIEILDHIIIGRRSPDRPRDFVSLRELGYFYS